MEMVYLLMTINPLHKDDMDTPERTIQDLQQISNGMIGKVFYKVCDDNNNYYRTVRLHFNPFSNSIQKQVSNPVYGVPPDGIPALPPMLLSRINCMNLEYGTSFY